MQLRCYFATVHILLANLWLKTVVLPNLEIFLCFVWMFALSLGIGHSEILRPKYPNFVCLARQCIEARRSISISSPDTNSKRGGEQMSRGWARHWCVFAHSYRFDLSRPPSARELSRKFGRQNRAPATAAQVPRPPALPRSFFSSERRRQPPAHFQSLRHLFDVVSLSLRIFSLCKIRKWGQGGVREGPVAGSLGTEGAASQLGVAPVVK
jgi:hypothetical protein